MFIKYPYPCLILTSILARLGNLVCYVGSTAKHLNIVIMVLKCKAILSILIEILGSCSVLIVG